jgi:hypothetical protein
MPGLNAQPVSGSLRTHDQSTEDRRVAAVRKKKKKRAGVLITDQPALRGEPANWGGGGGGCRAGFSSNGGGVQLGISGAGVGG